jgi:hypothetical protein
MTTPAQTDKRAIYLVSQESRADLILKIRERGFYLLGLLAAMDRPLAQVEIETLTGWATNTVTRALALLDFHGLAIRGRERGPWSPTQAGHNLVYGQPSTVEGTTLARVESSTVEGTSEIPPKYHHRPEARSSTIEGTPTPGFKMDRWGRRPLDGGGGDTNLTQGADESDPLGASRPRGDNPQPLRDDPALALRARQRRTACELMGINSPYKDEIINRDDIEAVFIFAHCYDADKQHIKKGAAVYRIRRLWSPSREAIRWADDQMHPAHWVRCKHCDHGFNVRLELGEDIADFSFDCPKCGKETEA